jgi:CheY-like chemotaxis protein
VYSGTIPHSVDELNLPIAITYAWNGEEGLKKLCQMKKENTLPCCIFTDINMPRLNGREVFIRIREDKELADIPIDVLSTSTSKPDMVFREIQGALSFET